MIHISPHRSADIDVQWTNVQGNVSHAEGTVSQDSMSRIAGMGTGRGMASLSSLSRFTIAPAPLSATSANLELSDFDRRVFRDLRAILQITETGQSSQGIFDDRFRNIPEGNINNTSHSGSFRRSSHDNAQAFLRLCQCRWQVFEAAIDTELELQHSKLKSMGVRASVPSALACCI